MKMDSQVEFILNDIEKIKVNDELKAELKNRILELEKESPRYGAYAKPADLSDWDKSDFNQEVAISILDEKENLKIFLKSPEWLDYVGDDKDYNYKFSDYVECLLNTVDDERYSVSNVFFDYYSLELPYYYDDSGVD